MSVCKWMPENARRRMRGARIMRTGTRMAAAEGAAQTGCPRGRQTPSCSWRAIEAGSGTRSKRAGEDPSCSVCIEQFEDGTIKTMPTCQHVFHKECIDEWLAQHSTCPNCRASLLTVLATPAPARPIRPMGCTFCLDAAGRPAQRHTGGADERRRDEYARAIDKRRKPPARGPPTGRGDGRQGAGGGSTTGGIASHEMVYFRLLMNNGCMIHSYAHPMSRSSPAPDADACCCEVRGHGADGRRRCGQGLVLVPRQPLRLRFRMLSRASWVPGWGGRGTE